jgi:Ca2+-binding EF-hand superfamily protein
MFYSSPSENGSRATPS